MLACQFRLTSMVVVKTPTTAFGGYFSLECPIFENKIFCEMGQWFRCKWLVVNYM